MLQPRSSSFVRVRVTDSSVHRENKMRNYEVGIAGSVEIEGNVNKRPKEETWYFGAAHVSHELEGTRRFHHVLTW